MLIGSNACSSHGFDQQHIDDIPKASKNAIEPFHNSLISNKLAEVRLTCIPWNLVGILARFLVKYSQFAIASSQVFLLFEWL